MEAIDESGYGLELEDAAREDSRGEWELTSVVTSPKTLEYGKTSDVQ